MSECVELLACMHAMKYSGDRQALRSWKSLFLQCSSLVLQELCSCAAGTFSSDSLRLLASFQQRLHQNETYKLGKGHACIEYCCAEIQIEMEDKEQEGGGGVQRVVVAHRLQSTFCIIHQPPSCFFSPLPSCPKLLQEISKASALL